MAELLLELFSEEIPARMQAEGALLLANRLRETLSMLDPATHIETYHGPRRIAAVLDVKSELPPSSRTERGPRVGAPESALVGFARKFGSDPGYLVVHEGYYTLQIAIPGYSASQVIAQRVPWMLRKFSWPKSMRWGGTSSFAWVRPLRRILCLLDGKVVPFDLRDSADDGHGLASGDLTEGHRFMAPGAVSVASVDEWRSELLARKVILDAAERAQRIWNGMTALAAERGLTVAPDEALLGEVTGLVEWPVPLIGRIDDAFMDLPPEVMQVSMRVNQRYFALRDGAGLPAPFFAFVANIEAPDCGAAIVAGNERVLRARFADARHFWDLDRSRTLESRLPALDAMAFHARLGSQGDRVRRLVELAGEHVIPQLVRRSTYPNDALYEARLQAYRVNARRAALLCKADLASGMVGEFPELQGVMGSYYAEHDGEFDDVVSAIRDHYLPRGSSDIVPNGIVAIAVALADRLDQLAGFFSIGARPSGSGDPFALRRAALGIIRIIVENGHWIRMDPLIAAAAAPFGGEKNPGEILGFLQDRLAARLREQENRHDSVEASFAGFQSDDLRLLSVRTEALTKFLDENPDLLAAYRRAVNILKIEESRDGCSYSRAIDQNLLERAEEHDLFHALRYASLSVHNQLQHDDFGGAMTTLAELRGAMTTLAELREPTDRFFNLLINDPAPSIRANRLALLAWLRDVMNKVADFSRIEARA